MTTLNRDAIVEAMARAISADHSGDLPEIAWQNAKARGETARYYSDSRAALDAALPLIGEWLAKVMEQKRELLRHKHEDDGLVCDPWDGGFAYGLIESSKIIRALCAGGEK